MNNITTPERPNLEAAVEAYIEKGWEVPVPLPAGKKYPPASGFTGRIKPVTDEKIRALWVGVSGSENLCLRMQISDSYGVIGIDVDHYDTKQGMTFLSQLMEELGDLNLSEIPRSTRRGVKAQSAQYFFRVPKDKEWEALACPDVDVVQFTHRYSAVWPSIVDGEQYKWYIGDQEADIPHVKDLPILPERWVNHLTRETSGRRGNGARKPVGGYRGALNWLRDNVSGWDVEVEETDDPNVTMSPAMRNASTSERFLEGLTTNAHDTMISAIHSVVMLGVEGHHGLKAAIHHIRKSFLAEVLDNRGPSWRSEDTAVDEFERAVTSEVEKIAGEVENGDITIRNISADLALPNFIDLLVPAEAEKATSSEKGSLGSTFSYGKMTFTSLENAVIRSAEWAWGSELEGGIPVGGLTIITGKPGDGKSTFCRWLASGITQGTLEGTWKGTPHGVLYLAAEEAVEHAQVPSFKANGAEMTKAVIPDLDSKNFDPSTDMEDVIQLCSDNDIKAVFVDPLTSYMGGVSSNNNSEYRELLKPWSRLAEAIDGVVIAIVHQTKSAGGDIVSGINGSSAYGEVARAVFGTAVDAESGLRVISQAKNSFGPLKKPREYALDAVPLETVDGKAKNAMRFMLGKETDLTAGEIFNRNKKVNSGEKETAKSWLRGYLETNPGAFRTDVTAAAKGLYSGSSLDKAKVELNVRKETIDGKACWYLP